MSEILLPPQSKSGLYVPRFMPWGHLPDMKPHEYKAGDVLYSYDEIQSRLREITPSIVERYRYHGLIVVPVLKGAMWAATDLVSHLYEGGLDDVQISPIGIGSYGANTTSSGVIKLNYDMDLNPHGKHVLVVEDIVDTGRSLEFLYAHLQAKDVAGISTFALLSKPAQRTVPFEADWYGFEIPSWWVQGYGLDTDQIGRGNPNIVLGPVYPRANPASSLVVAHS